MGEVIQHKFTGRKCCICGKEATRLCDAIIGESSYIGHPPKKNGVVDWNTPMSNKVTCDKPLCDKHATAITEGMDLCPEHAKNVTK